MRVEILKNTGPTTVTKKWFEDGNQVDAGAVTYALIDADGTIQDSGSATKSGSGVSTEYTVAVSVADAAEVEEYRLEWIRTDTGAKLVDDVGIVGSILFTEDEARNFDVIGGQNPLSNTTSYDDQAIAEARYRVGETLEKRTGVSMVRRFAKIRAAGKGRDELALALAERTHGGPGYRRRPLTLIRGTVNGTALSAGEISSVEVDSLAHKFTRYDGSSWSAHLGDQPPRNVILSYEYGYDVVPWEANRAALMLLMTSIVPTDVTTRATSMSNPDGTFRLSIPSLNTPTGIPEIDEFIVAYDERPVFA